MRVCVCVCMLRSYVLCGESVSQWKSFNAALFCCISFLWRLTIFLSLMRSRAHGNKALTCFIVLQSSCILCQLRACGKQMSGFITCPPNKGNCKCVYCVYVMLQVACGMRYAARSIWYVIYDILQYFDMTCCAFRTQYVVCGHYHCFMHICCSLVFSFLHMVLYR